MSPTLTADQPNLAAVYVEDAILVEFAALARFKNVTIRSSDGEERVIPYMELRADGSVSYEAENEN